jgi:hypothetical protein
MSMSIAARIGVTCLIVSVCSGSVHADVTGYGIGYQLNHSQSGPSTVTMYGCSCYWSLAAAPGDLSTCTTTSPTGLRYPSIEVLPGIFQGGESFTTTRELFDAFPLGRFRMSVSGGAIGARTGNVTTPDPLHMPNRTPAFSRSQFGEYQSINSLQDYTFRFNTFTSTGEQEYVYFVIDAYPSTARVFFAQLAPGDSACTVPAGSIRLNRRYYATLYFVSSVETSDDGFGGASSSVQAMQSTRILIRTVGDCPADYSGDGFVDFFDYLEFVADFEGGNPDSDYNGDGFVDFFDYTDFVTAFQAPC